MRNINFLFVIIRIRGLNLKSHLKLPKQWRHWCSKANLRPECQVRNKFSRSTSNWVSLKGRGRVWRIAMKDPYDRSAGHLFQAGDNYSDFDRWALSPRISFEIPRTFEEFLKLVESLDGVNLRLSNI